DAAWPLDARTLGRPDGLAGHRLDDVRALRVHPAAQYARRRDARGSDGGARRPLFRVGPRPVRGAEDFARRARAQRALNANEAPPSVLNPRFVSNLGGYAAPLRGDSGLQTLS